MRIGFYAPLKAPTHPVPSGDRRVAQALMSALLLAGHDVVLAADFRSYDGSGSPERQSALKAEGEAIADDLLSRYLEPAGWRPDIWFTYHLYHKAPDWLGPAVSKALGIPYLIAEASIAPKQAGGPWDIGYRGANAAIESADAVFCLTRLDMECVGQRVDEGSRLHYLPPFIDSTPFAEATANRDACRQRLVETHRLDPASTWLLAVGMMRLGDKLASYRLLGDAMSGIMDREWQLLIVGDGDARGAVREALSVLGDRVVFLGLKTPGELPAIYAAADLYVWPASGEAFGIALLEAQAAGLAVVAGRERGVPDVVVDGETGLLAPLDADGSFADAVASLLSDTARRKEMALAAQQFVGRDRNLASAARRVNAVIESIVS